MFNTESSLLRSAFYLFGRFDRRRHEIHRVAEAG